MIKSSPWNAAPIGCRALGDGIYDPDDGGPEQPQTGPFLPSNGRRHADGAGVAVPPEQQEGVPVVVPFGVSSGVISIIAQ